MKVSLNRSETLYAVLLMSGPRKKYTGNKENCKIYFWGWIIDSIFSILLAVRLTILRSYSCLFFFIFLSFFLSHIQLGFVSIFTGQFQTPRDLFGSCLSSESCTDDSNDYRYLFPLLRHTPLTSPNYCLNDLQEMFIKFGKLK